MPRPSCATCAWPGYRARHARSKDRSNRDRPRPRLRRPADHAHVLAMADRVTVFFKDRIHAGDDVLRGVLSLVPSAVATQAIAAAGADFVLIDREHGPIDRETVHAMIAATGGTSCAPLVRVPGVDEAEVAAALDAGAEGIVFPMIRTPEEAERCVSYV